MKHTSTIVELTSGGEAFDRVYLSNYPALYSYAFTMLADKQLAEEMVHQVFLKMLERSAPINIHTSIKAYLYRAVNNECLNYIKHQKVKQGHQNYTMNTMNHQTETPANKLQFRELEQRLHKAINDLPLQCRIVFQMSRFEELKYAEIATELGISIKTVENQMGKALKRLRAQLADYLPLILWILMNLI